MPDIIRGNSPTQIPIRPATIQRPFAYQYATPPINQRGNVNGHRVGDNSKTFSSLGSAFGPWGALLGAGVGLATDLLQVRVARRNAEKANEEARKAAAESSARSLAEARAARNWNSEQEQIRRMRMAGLSPGLAYGQMSPSTAQPASQDKADISKADTPKIDNESLLRALQYLVAQQQADTAAAAQQSTSQLQGSQVDLNTIDKLFRGQQYQANIASILADKDLTDAKKLEILKLLSAHQNLLESQANAADASARQSNASADVTEQTGVRSALSQIASNYGSANLSNADADYTRNPLTSKTYADTRVSNQTANEISLRYGLQRNKVDFVADILSEHGLPYSAIPYALDFASALAAQSGKSLPDVSLKTLASWFSGDNWIPFISQSLNRSSNERIASGYQAVAREGIESREKIAAGHDAVQLEIVDRYITNGAKNFSSTNNSRINEYRSEFALLNSSNQSKVHQYIQFLKDSGEDDADISERAAYFTHKLFEAQQQQASSRKR